MEPGGGTPLLDFFKRGEVDRDIRLMAAQCVLGLRPHEQLGLLELLVNDRDPEVAAAARAGLAAMTAASRTGAEPRSDAAAEAAAGEEQQTTALERIAAMSPPERLALAMRGTREERAILVRDPNKIVAVAVLSSPKISDSEVESIAKMANVSEDVLRIIGHTRAWMKKYAIVSSLTKNPKTPVAVSLNLLPRLLEKDVKVLATDRNVPDVVRLAARKRLTPGR
ncbi:MAG: hypothetical protein HYY76_19495 [Acidobacteria bacterium]|nr:hypothetical protein [Acidobacteriota bacterium]